MHRSASVDFFKLLLAFCVVALHAHIFTESSTFLSFIFVNGILRIAVPLFFMLNGYYFYNLLYRKLPVGPWVKRMAFLYALWMVIYAPFYVPTDFHSHIEMMKFLITLVVGYHHLWYLIGTLGAGGVLYFLRKKTDAQIFYTAIVLFAIGVVMQYVFDYGHSTHESINHLFNQDWMFRNFLLLGFPMFALGYLLAKDPRRLSIFSRQEAIGFASAGLVLLLIESGGNFFLHRIHDNFDNCAALILVCPFIFMLVLKMPGVLATDKVSKISTVIYFIHPLIISALTSLAFLPLGSSLAIAAVVISLLLAPAALKLNTRFSVNAF